MTQQAPPAVPAHPRARWGMPRSWVWLQLLIGWVPIWALYSTLIFVAHAGTPPSSAVFAGFRATLCAAALGLVVHRLTQRVPWPSPMRWSFMAVQLVAAPLYAVSWVALTMTLELALFMLHGGRGHGSSGAPVLPFLLLGGWMYAMVAGVSYALQASQRVAQAESLAARSQLATLRAQLNPHFLFNALHTVVQLIPLEPARASHAAERLASLLRRGLEQQRDLISLTDEMTFVSEYVELEQLRFGDRLAVSLSFDRDVANTPVPSFAVQTLVENSVRHGAAQKVATTTVRVRAERRGDQVVIDVQDDGVGADASALERGTGLPRLRDRLHALFGARGHLSIEATTGAGVHATILVPYDEMHDA